MAVEEAKLALLHYREVLLGYLVALGQVRVEVVLPVELDPLGHAAIQSKGAQYGFLEAVCVQHREHAGEGEVDHVRMLVGLGQLSSERGGEQLSLRVHLGMDFEAHLQLEVLENIVDFASFVGFGSGGCCYCVWADERGLWGCSD